MTDVAQQPRKAAPDQDQRDAAVRERGQNVLIDAGAGTGKTSILVDRLVEMVAPCNGARSVSISRVAAITFTRKAAGDLRLRIRERLLQELAGSAPGTKRDDQLRDALAGLDTAYVGTIHSFADRLLRLDPMEAQLSPSYEVAEDDAGLIRETFEVLIHAVETDNLHAELSGTEAVSRANEAAQTLLNALEAGLTAEDRETEWMVYYGLFGLVEGFIRARDLPPPETTPAAFDAAAFQAAAAEFVRLAAAIRAGSRGADWILRTADLLGKLRKYDDPVQISLLFGRQLDAAPRDVTKKNTFAGDNEAWQVWKRFTGRDDQPSLRDQLKEPVDRWLATQLVGLFPVVVALYEKVKARHHQLDQLDLLMKLRSLLANNKRLRSKYQKLFDHIFVDEFQDTDPLQAEIVLYLCEREAAADRWEDVILADGKVTLVGDPKQSIYRFRRADIAMYDRVRAVVMKRQCLETKLSANFRSLPGLIAWLNDRFDRVLGTSPSGQPFDPATGIVFQQRLLVGREGPTTAAVCVVPFDFGDGQKHSADAYRQLEGQVLSRYLRWLVESSNIEIADPVDGRRRRIQYGDIAVLAVTTWRLSLLFPWLDLEGIPYASRGGRLFLEDPPHRQFILGLRALADRTDGVAEAALLRPPFFAIDFTDLLQERASGKQAQAGDERVKRAAEAREMVRELRQRRFDQSPGRTARELLERTAFGRAVALGPNGTQRLTRLRELCLELERIAAQDGLDYDSVTARLREWIERPVELDPPHPVGTEALQVMTVHQAKGLEFPVVVVWDGKGQWRTRPDSFAWRVERDGRGLADGP
jgi:ATP-dependent helicase/nuclease subunit A